MTDREILQGIDKLEDGIPFDEIRNGDKWLDIHELLSEIRERIGAWHYPSKGEYPVINKIVFLRLKSSVYKLGCFMCVSEKNYEWCIDCDRNKEVDRSEVLAWQYIVPPKEEE